MGDISILKLLNIFIRLSKEERETIVESDMFANVRALLDKSAEYINVSDSKACIKQLRGIVSCITQCTLDHLTHITATNKGMSNYILRSLEKQKEVSLDPIKFAATLCALGNAGTEYNDTNGINGLIAEIRNNEHCYLKTIEENGDFELLDKYADRLYFHYAIAQAVCTFMVAKYGSVEGVGEHFGQNVKDIPTDLAETAEGTAKDTFTEDVAGNESIELFDLYGTILTGVEHLITRDPSAYVKATHEQQYAIGVLMSYNIVTPNVEGLEGATWDKVKAGFVKAFKIVRDGLVTIKENYFDKSLEETADQLKESADENKKALNAISQKDAVLTESAKAGITRLGEATGSDEIKTIIGGLSNVSSAPGVIDKLMGVFTKTYNETQELQKEFNTVDKNLKQLESQVNDAPGDDDKEAIAVKKQAITEKSKETRDQFDDLKKKLGDQRKHVTAIAKAIRGITPSIFYAPKADDNKDE